MSWAEKAEIVREEEYRQFLSSERLNLAYDVLGAVKQELSSLGVRTNSPLWIALVKGDENQGGFEAEGDVLVLNINYVGKSKSHFAYIFTQGVLIRTFLRELDEGGKMRRLGLGFLSEEPSLVLEALSTGVCRKMTVEILEKHFPHMLQPHPDSYCPPPPLTQIIDRLCQVISQTHPQQYPHPSDVFHLFKKVAFMGETESNSLRQAFKEVYGEDGLSQLVRLIEGVWEEKGILESGKIIPALAPREVINSFDFNCPAGKKLQAFLERPLGNSTHPPTPREWN